MRIRSNFLESSKPTRWTPSSNCLQRVKLSTEHRWILASSSIFSITGADQVIGPLLRSAALVPVLWLLCFMVSTWLLTTEGRHRWNRQRKRYCGICVSATTEANKERKGFHRKTIYRRSSCRGRKQLESLNWKVRHVVWQGHGFRLWTL